MKKTLSRALCLLLVLVMVLGVMPVASAGTVTLTLPLSQANSVPLTPPSDCACESSGHEHNYYMHSWSLDGGSYEYTYNGNPKEYSFSSVGTYQITCISQDIAADNYKSKESTDTWTINVVDDPKVASVAMNKSSTTVRAGATETLSATVTLEEDAPANTPTTVTWRSSSNSFATVDNNGVVTGVAKGQATITATSTEDPNKSAACTVTVQAPALSSVAIDNPGISSLSEGQSIDLNATLSPAAAEASLAWSIVSGKASIVPSTGVLIAGEYVTGGTNKIVVKVTATDSVDNSIKKESTIELTVEDGAYSVDVNPASLTLVPGGTGTLTASVKDNTGAALTSGYSLVWQSLNPTYATVAPNSSPDGSATVTATNALGKTNILVTATITETGKTYTAICPVTVSGGKIIADNKSVAVAGSTVVGTATIPVSYTNAAGQADSTVELYYKVGSSSSATETKVTGSSITVQNAGFGVVPVTITAKKDGEVLDTITVYASFYLTNDVEVTMVSGQTILEFDDHTDIAGATTTAQRLSTQILNGLGVGATVASDSIAFTTTDVAKAIGVLKNLDYYGKTSVSSLGNVDFQITGGAGGKYTFSYEVTRTSSGLSDLTVGAGAVTILFDGSMGDIQYSTTYNKPVTFSESDFATFWAKGKLSSSLDYVKFNLNGYPSFGKMYTKPNTTNTAYLAYSSDNFHYGSYTAATSYDEDLGSVTYVPDVSKASEYSVSIPFVCYGTKAGETLSGTVLIKLNEKGNDIYSRGLVFGSGYDDDIAAAYKAATGKTLGYVVFTLPAVSDGTMYYSIPSYGGNSKVAQAKELLSGAELYYERTTGKNMLYNAAFVPAAGKTGKVTLSYTAYDASGNGAYKDTLTLNVISKSKSEVFTDVTAKSYSWAADSVDFLYYEGTAQGSNGKYNPAANITRQDFMLMLYRAFLAEDYGTTLVSNNFPDVVKGTSAYSQEIYQAVGVAKYLGIAQGTNDKFNPKANITRQEAMVLIYRTLGVINRNLENYTGVKASSFKDYNKIGSWATVAITDLVSHGVIQGTNDYIKPAANITRAEMACILHRVLTY